MQRKCLLAFAAGRNRLDQSMHMIDRGELRDSMPEVKDVADTICADTKAANHFSNLRLDMRWGSQQDGGVKIALQGALISYACPGLSEVGRPVQTQSGAARCRSLFQPEPTTLICRQSSL